MRGRSCAARGSMQRLWPGIGTGRDLEGEDSMNLPGGIELLVVTGLLAGVLLLAIVLAWRGGRGRDKR